MGELEDKLSAVMANPQLMQQIMAMAQNFSVPQDSPPPPQAEVPSMPNIDLSAIQKLTGLAGQSSVDKNQQQLLRALGPYLCREKVSKLEKAMRAAKMARLATSVLGGKLSLGR